MKKFTIAVPAESQDGERRVALTPASVAAFPKNVEIRIFRDAGVSAHHSSRSYAASGAKVIDRIEDLFEGADTTLRVKRAHPEIEAEELALWPKNMALVGFLDPQVADKSHLPKYAATGINAYTLEFMPQSERTRPMDATAAMSTVTGEVVMHEAAERLDGNIRNKEVLVIGVGNAGLSAAIHAIRKGANVTALSTSRRWQQYLELNGVAFNLLHNELDGTMSDGDALITQQNYIRSFLSNADIIVCSARRVGKKAPNLIPASFQHLIKPEALVYDLTASSGGNCEGSVYGTDIRVGNFTICSKKGYPKALPVKASASYAECAAIFLRHLFSGSTELDSSILATTLIARGQINPAASYPGADAKQFQENSILALAELRERYGKCR